MLPRVGRRLGVRTIGVDYQHVVNDLDLRSVPLATRLPLAVLRLASRIFYPTVDQNIVSSFHPYPARRKSQRSARCYHRISVLLRKELQSTCSPGNHLLVKMNSEFNVHWLDELANSRLPARIYGTTEFQSSGNLTFRKTNESFAEDLLSCAGVITDSGNQLIGEALACGKSVLAIPNQADYHKWVSALFLSRGDVAGARTARSLTSQSLRSFYEDSATNAAPPIRASNTELLSLIDGILTV